jgi:GntR family transcriptional regulator
VTRLPGGQDQNVKSPELPSERIERDLRARIDADEWAHGEQLPTTRELADHYQVSRETVARVVRKLTDAGFLVTRDRWGVFRA